MNFGRRPHGLIELVCGDDSFLFPTCLPEWLNWPLLQAFLEPISHCDHFGMGMMDFCNGDRLSQRLVQCGSGFFVQVYYSSTFPSFFLSELLQGAHMQANTLHMTEVNPESRRVRWSAVFVAGGPTLIASRHYETVDFHAKRELVAELRSRFPDLATTNFVQSTPLCRPWDPVANFARQRFVRVSIEEELQYSMVLKLDLPPYRNTGAIIVPPVLRKDRLVMQTGAYLVCGPGGELCICYHNGLELYGEKQIQMHDGDYCVLVGLQCQAE